VEAVWVNLPISPEPSRYLSEGNTGWTRARLLPTIASCMRVPLTKQQKSLAVSINDSRVQSYSGVSGPKLLPRRRRGMMKPREAVAWQRNQRIGVNALMPIPPLNPSGTLPPFTGASAADPGMSPYAATMREVAQMFCTSQHRAELFNDWVRYRKALVSAGLSGFQWVDGSYCEDVERLLGRDPADIDLVTAIIRPVHLHNHAAWAAFFAANVSLFDRAQIKSNYRCDSLLIDVTFPAFAVHPQLTYCFGLFTHQRVTHLWKGLLQVQLPADDDDAVSYIGTLSFAP
jgi:hypothetical protein